MIHRELFLGCIGDQGCGKSSFLRCISEKGAGQSGEDSFLVGVFDKENIEIKIDAAFTSLVTIQNISGKETLDGIRKESISNVDGFLALFSLNDPLSLDSIIKKWIPEARLLLGPDVPIVLIGTKSDARKPEENSGRQSKRFTAVKSEEGQNACKKLKCVGYYETSARLGGIVIMEAVQSILAPATIFKLKKNNRAIPSVSKPIESPTRNKRSSMNFLSRVLSMNKSKLSQKLMEAVSSGDRDAVLDLLSKGAHVSFVNQKEITPLHAAAMRGDADMLNILLYAGGDLNIRDSNGATALHVACQNGDFNCVKALVDRGADVHAKNLINNTPLHDAAGSGSREIVFLLLSKGADENAKDSFGNTPKEKAVISGHPMLFYNVEETTKSNEDEYT